MWRNRRTSSNLARGQISTPYVGQFFNREEEAHIYSTTKYARYRGFGTRKGSFHMSKKTNECSGRRYLCTREGSKNMNAKRKRRVKRRRIVRGGCKARMVINMDKSKGLWVVIIFDDNHNHPLVNTPAMVAKLRSRKKVIPSCETMIDDLHKCHQRFHK